jgi:hypothetical protein
MDGLFADATMQMKKNQHRSSKKANKILCVPEERQLLRSLEEAIRDIDVGKGVPLEEVRKRVVSWVVK